MSSQAPIARARNKLLAVWLFGNPPVQEEEADVVELQTKVAMDENSVARVIKSGNLAKVKEMIEQGVFIFDAA